MKPPSTLRLYAVLCALILISHTSAQSAPASWRDADTKEIVGAWEYNEDRRYQNPFWYLVVREDGHLGWIRSSERLAKPTKSYLIEMIEKETVSGNENASWETHRLSPGHITVDETKNHVEEYFVVWVGTPPENMDKVVIGQAYKLPPPCPAPTGGQPRRRTCPRFSFVKFTDCLIRKAGERYPQSENLPCRQMLTQKSRYRLLQAHSGHLMKPFPSKVTHLTHKISQYNRL